MQHLLRALVSCTFYSFCVAVHHEKFSEFFPYYGEVLGNQISGQHNVSQEQLELVGGKNCSAQYTTYLSTDTARDATSACYLGVSCFMLHDITMLIFNPIVYDCIYEDLLPNEQQNFASANVMLGLTPTILSSIAPSVGEISLLSSRRPLMATLLSIGGPAVYVARSLTYQSPIAILRPTSSLFTQTRKPMSDRRHWPWLALQYAAAAAAVFNVAHTSWQLGSRTVITWKCNTSYMPVLWSTLAAVIHIVAAIGWHSSYAMRQLRNEQRLSHGVSTWLSGLAQTVRQELTLSVDADVRLHAHKTCATDGGASDTAPVEERDEFWLTIFAMQLADIASFVHLVFGTLVFSSLMFIATLDAATVVLRYMVSGLLCRFVLLYELSGMRSAEMEEGVADDG